MKHYPPKVPPRSARPWRKIRQRILVRDGFTCQQCGKSPANHVDHIIPRSMGGTDQPGNLQVLCSTCNQRKGG